MAQAELLIVGVPSHGFRETLDGGEGHDPPVDPRRQPDARASSRDSLLRMTEVIKEVLPGHPAAALTGPNIAREIMERPGGGERRSPPRTWRWRGELQRVLRRGLLRVYTNHDVIGCELGGALKNVVAIACGIAQGLGVGDNTRAAVMTRGLAELTRLGVAMGGQPATFAGLAGMGDLIATCISPHSRNRHVGEQLGAGRTLDRDPRRDDDGGRGREDGRDRPRAGRKQRRADAGVRRRSTRS